MEGLRTYVNLTVLVPDLENRRLHTIDIEGRHFYATPSLADKTKPEFILRDDRDYCLYNLHEDEQNNFYYRNRRRDLETFDSDYYKEHRGETLIPSPTEVCQAY